VHKSFVCNAFVFSFLYQFGKELARALPLYLDFGGKWEEMANFFPEIADSFGLALLALQDLWFWGIVSIAFSFWCLRWRKVP
jgi:hypothetical protein